jgi:curved DNA-binding protein CbpA
LVDSPANPDFFQLLGFPEALDLDAETLRQKFYALSRLTHPDRYSHKDALLSLRASRWSQHLNSAYQTLRDRAKRAAYLIERYEVKAQEGVPLALAETYFDLQDLLAEPEGVVKLKAFHEDLTERLQKLESGWPTLVKAFETAELKKPVVEKVSEHFALERFLSSMLADIESKKGAQ